jgi:hypothetical protein
MLKYPKICKNKHERVSLIVAQYLRKQVFIFFMKCRNLRLKKMFKEEEIRSESMKKMQIKNMRLYHFADHIMM